MHIEVLGSSQAKASDIAKTLKSAWTGDANLIGKLTNLLIFAFGKTVNQRTKIASALYEAGFKSHIVAFEMIKKGWIKPGNWPLCGQQPCKGVAER